MYSRTCKVFLAATLLVLVAGCATRGVNQPLAQTQNFAKALAQTPTENGKGKVLLLAPDVNLFELSAGGQRERVPDWNNKARDHITATLRDAFRTSKSFEVVEAPALTAGEQFTLDEHIALYVRVGGEAFSKTATNDAAWKHKRDDFDYTVGNGLAYLRERTGADVALVTVASDTYRSAGNKVLTGLVMVAGAAVGVAIVPASAPAFMTVGLIELRTGHIQWLNFASQGLMTDMRERDGANSLVTATLKPLLTPAAPPAVAP